MPSSAPYGASASNRGRACSSLSPSCSPGSSVTCSMPTWKWQGVNQAWGTWGSVLPAAAQGIRPSPYAEPSARSRPMAWASARSCGALRLCSLPVSVCTGCSSASRAVSRGSCRPASAARQAGSLALANGTSRCEAGSEAMWGAGMFRLSGMPQCPLDSTHRMQTPYELILGWRYTRAGRATRRNGFISFISGVSMLGIALGVAALIIVLSVMNGFQKEVRDRMLGVLSHIEVFEPSGQAIPNLADTLARIERHPEVVGAAPFVGAQALIARGEDMKGALVPCTLR
eukprot:Opistho-1_new@6816